VVRLKEAIQALKDDSTPPEKTNHLLKEIIDKIYITTTDKGMGNTDIHLEIYLNF
jgi:hypothetical protein